MFFFPHAFLPRSRDTTRFSPRLNGKTCSDNKSNFGQKQVGLPLWIISLDLSKTFDTVKWETLCEALRRQKISDQLIWVLGSPYPNQTSVVRDEGGDKRNFDIQSGVRQGCG